MNNETGHTDNKIVNVCQYSSELLIESYKKLYLQQWKYFYTFSLIAVLNLLVNAYFFQSIYLLFFSIIFCLYLALSFFVSPRRHAKITIKRILETNNEFIISDIHFLDDQIDVYNRKSGSMYSIKYKSIKRVLQTKHALLMHTFANQFIALDRDGFTSGNYEDFKQLMISKLGSKRVKLK